MARIQQRKRAAVEDVDGRFPIRRLNVTGGYDAELLMGLVVLAFGDSVEVYLVSMGGALVDGMVYRAKRIEVKREWRAYLSCCRAMVFWIFDVLEAIVMNRFAILYD